jgi:acyl-CoA synthetase (AMP-forming)/AMP-acid ligase II
LRGIARRRGLALPDYASVVPDARHVYAGRWLPGVPTGALRLSAMLTSKPTAETAVGAGVAAKARNGLRSELQREALIIFTSGTTDDPKAVVHTRGSLGTGLDDFAAAIEFVPGERVVTDQLMIGIPALIGGAHWSLPPAGTDPGARPEKYLRLLPEADVLFAVPAALDAILTLLERRPELTPRPRAVLLGGAPVLRPLLERVRAQLPGARIHAIYGMTEILPVAIADGDEKLAFTGPGDLVGTVMPRIRARIDGDEKLAFTGPGDLVGTVMPRIRARIDDGELVLAGEGLAPHYLGKPPLGELRTGDLARLDGDRLVLEGRAKDMFIRGTTNVYPGLYEPVIAGLPGIAEVAMVGVPDDIGDDALVLVVVPRARL